MSNQTHIEFQELLTRLLQCDYLKTPIKTQDDYHDELERALNFYLTNLKSIEKPGSIKAWLDDNESGIQESIGNLLSALKCYLMGNSGNAYKKIEEYFNNKVIQESLVVLTTDITTYITSRNIPKALYRVRQSATKVSTREEMFHVPFNKRHLVSNQRYSIAGVPCLYLGSSFFICWEELGRPNLNTLYISAFKTDSSIKVLDLSFSFESLRDIGLDPLSENEFSEDEIKAYISLFPLVHSCSFNRKNADGKFNAEYVIPNLILQWVSEEKSGVAGIKYRSTKVKDVKYCEHIHNFVFPPKISEYQNKSFCKHLIESFCMTAPYPFEVLDAIESDMRNESLGSNIEIEDELKVSYQKTKFYEIESKILRYGKFERIDGVGSISEV